MLRHITLLLALAISLAPLCEQSKASPDDSYQQNDLLLFLLNPTGTTGTDRVVLFSLGSTWNVFRKAATPNDPTFGSVISLGNINTILTSTYGADWTGLSSSLFLGAVGQNGSTSSLSSAVSNGDFARTVYVTKPRLGAGSVGVANSSAAAVPTGNSAGVAGAISTANSIAGNTNVVTSNPVNLPNSGNEGAASLVLQNPFGPTGAPATAYTAIQGGVVGETTNAPYKLGSVSNVVNALDLYRVTPSTSGSTAWQNLNNISGVTAGQGYYLGTLTLSDNGDVNFVARQAEPEIALTGDDLTGMTTTQNVPSAPKNLTITAKYIGTSDLEITMPPGFEVSTNGGTSYATTGTIAPTSGAVNATVRVRIAATATQGDLGGDVSVSASSKSETKPISGTVGAPAPSVAISGTLSGFVTTAGTASAAQTFSVSGSNLTGTLTITAPSGFEVRLAGSGAYEPLLSIAHAGGVVSSTNLEVRIAASALAGVLTGNISVASAGATSRTLAVSGTVNAPPSLSVSPASLGSFTATAGTASAAQTFTVSGANLTGNVTVTAPTGFEVSSNGTSFGHTATVNESSGSASGTISVRIAASAVAGSPSGNIGVASSGATSRSVAVSGTVVPAPSLSTSSSLTSFTTTQGTPSAAQTFTVSGANLTGNVTVSAPVGFEVSNGGSIYAGSLNLTPSSGTLGSTTISVRIAASAANGPVSGNVSINSAGASESTIAVSGFVGSDPAIAVVANLSAFTATQGSVSAAQTFTVSGANLTGNVTVTAPTDFELSTDGTNFFASRALTPSSGSLDVSSISVRIKTAAPVGAVSGNITVSSTGATSQTLSLSGTVVPPPSITTTGTLVAFNTTAGTASAVQTFNVSGANLTGNVTLTTPSGFEVSNDGTTYAGSLTLTQSGGTLAGTTISVRIAAAAVVGSPSGNIGVASSGATSRSVAVSGTVVPPPSLSTSGTLTSFTTTEGTASSVQPFTVSGSNLTGNVTVTAPSGFEVSSNGTSFSPSLALTPTTGAVSASISVRVAAVAPSGSLSGNISVATVGVTPQTVAVNATVTASPRMHVEGSLVPFSAISGTASAEQTLQLSGSNLTGNVTIAVPERYEVSRGGGQPYASSSLIITPVSGSIVNQSIFVRLAAAPVGNYSGDLGFSTPGASAIKVAVSGTVVPPPTVNGSASFVTFSSTQGSASASQSFSVSGANLTAPVTITAPTGYEVSIDNSSFGSTQTINPQNGAVASELFIRIAATAAVGSPSGTVRIISTGATERSLAVSGKVVPPPSLAIGGTLLPLSTKLGTASAGRTFTVSGTDLTGSVTVTAPTGFEVTGQRRPYAKSIVLTPSQGRLDVQVTVRISRTATIGNLSGSISATTNGAAPKQIAVQGSVSALPNLVLGGSLRTFGTTRNRPSASQSFTVAASALNGMVSVTAPAGFQVSLNNSNFGARVQINPVNQVVASTRIWIRLAAGSKSRVLSGNVTASSNGASTKIIRVSGRIR